jgi:hypothetical protein
MLHGDADVLEHRLAGLIISVLAESTSRTANRHAGYQPAALAISSRHGIYSANLVLFILVLSPSVTASEPPGAPPLK